MRIRDRVKLLRWAATYQPSSAEGRSNPESPLSNPADWFVDWVTGGGPTDAGVTVSEQSAMRLAAVYACVRVLSEDVASLGKGVYKKRKGGGKDKVDDHYLSPILETACNPLMTPFTLFETQQGHVTTKGNCYSFIEWNGAGEVANLWPMAPSATSVLQDEKDASKVVYEYNAEKEKLNLLPQEVVHVRGLGSDGLIGYSPLELAREVIGLGLAAQKHGSQFFGEGATPDGVLTTDKALNKEQRRLVLEGWKAAHQNKRNVAILSGGLKFESVSLPPEQAQFVETRKMQVTEIARIFRVPPHKIADLERATFSNIEHQDLAYIKYSLMSWALRWEQELNLKLFTPKQRKAGYFVAFDFDPFLRADIKSRAVYNKTAILTGWKNRNEVREADGLNPGPPELDEFLVPTNMVESDDLDEAGDEITPTPTVGDDGTPSSPTNEEEEEEVNEDGEED